ncbi:MAG TPA: hypothetical protein VFJ16_22085 [Longimicrobium sp.]|nr:hypothetical protein [Longimicrobium sp.]
MEIPTITITYPEWVNTKVQQLRELYERAGFEVLERPGEESFPFAADFPPLYRPALLAIRGKEHHVVEVRERPGSIGRLMERFYGIRTHRDWFLHLVTSRDVVSHDVPEAQRELRPWHELKRSLEETTLLPPAVPAWVRLLALLAVLEGVMRRIARDDGVPIEMLSAPWLVSQLHHYGLLPYDSYFPLHDALEVHRRVRHGFAMPDEKVGGAVRAVLEWLPELFPRPEGTAAAAPVPGEHRAA